MNPDIISAAVAVFLAIIAGAWVLLKVATGQWEKRQDMQFKSLNENVAAMQNQMTLHYADMARLELKLSESEKNTLINFALKRDLENVQRTFDARAVSILEEVKGMSTRLDEWLKVISGYMDRQSDKKQHQNNL